MTDWEAALIRKATALGLSTHAGIHLAILQEPFFSRLVDGTKTVESRWSMHRCAPYGTIDVGDLVFFKRTGGCSVTHWFLARAIHHSRNLAASLPGIRVHLGPRLGLDEPQDDFWKSRAGKRYATLIEVDAVHQLAAPVTILKRDRRGWVTLRRSLALPEVAHA